MATISDLFAHGAGKSTSRERRPGGMALPAGFDRRPVSLPGRQSIGPDSDDAGQGRGGRHLASAGDSEQPGLRGGAVQFGQHLFRGRRLCPGPGLLRASHPFGAELPKRTTTSAARLHQLGRHADAIAAYQQAIECRAAYPEAWYNLGNVHQHQGNLDDALRTATMKPCEFGPIIPKRIITSPQSCPPVMSSERRWFAVARPYS